MPNRGVYRRWLLAPIESYPALPCVRLVLNRRGEDGCGLNASKRRQVRRIFRDKRRSATIVVANAIVLARECVSFRGPADDDALIGIDARAPMKLHRHRLAVR